MKLVSVIVPSLHSPLIQHTIKALENQDFDKSLYEVVIVGLDQYDLIQVNDLVRFENTKRPLNPAEARNHGVEHTDGEIIVFTDSDCIPHPNWLQILTSHFTNSDVSVVGGSVDIDSDNFWTRSDNLCMFFEYLPHHPYGTRHLLASLNLAIRRQAYNDVHGFDERYPLPAGEDSDLSIRLRQAGYTLYFEPNATVIHNPSRKRFSAMLKHSFNQGKFSIKVDQRYVSEEGIPSMLRTRPGLILTAPVLALGATMRIFWDKTIISRYAFSAPFIYLAKIAWCLGAATHPVW